MHGTLGSGWSPWACVQTARVPQVLDVGLDPHQALEKNEQCRRLFVEQDLKAVLHEHISASGRWAHYRHQQAGGNKNGAQLCYSQAERLFDDVIEVSKFDAELKSSEHAAFKDRFVLAMNQKCKDLISERLWIEEAGKELEQQKPVMTAAVAASVNAAGLGFKTMRLQDQKDVVERTAPKLQSENISLAFRAELWPQCKEVILKFHNQGHCGACRRRRGEPRMGHGRHQEHLRAVRRRQVRDASQSRPVPGRQGSVHLRRPCPL